MVGVSKPRYRFLRFVPSVVFGNTMEVRALWVAAGVEWVSYPRGWLVVMRLS